MSYLLRMRRPVAKERTIRLFGQRLRSRNCLRKCCLGEGYCRVPTPSQNPPVLLGSNPPQNNPPPTTPLKSSCPLNSPKPRCWGGCCYPGLPRPFGSAWVKTLSLPSYRFFFLHILREMLIGKPILQCFCSWWFMVRIGVWPTSIYGYTWHLPGVGKEKRACTLEALAIPILVTEGRVV